MTASENRCHCGCGGKTNTDQRGEPRKFLQGHNSKLKVSEGWIDQGHRFISVNGKRIAEHRHVVEQREGRKLGSDEIIHHVDGDPLNNQSDNLVILTRSEHMRLHMAGRRVRKWTVEEQTRAGALYMRGMTVDEVARALGRPYPSTRHVLSRQSLTRTTIETRSLRRLTDLTSG
jgi:hypothetical protein